jgi:hypothetical protein
MTSKEINKRKEFLKGTNSSNLEYVLQQHLSTFLRSFAAEENGDKRALLIDAILNFEYAERPRKAFIIDASKFEDNRLFRFVNPNGTIGDFYTNSTSGGRRRTNKHKKHHKKTKRY